MRSSIVLLALAISYASAVRVHHQDRRSHNKAAKAKLVASGSVAAEGSASASVTSAESAVATAIGDTVVVTTTDISGAVCTIASAGGTSGSSSTISGFVDLAAETASASGIVASTTSSDLLSASPTAAPARMIKRNKKNEGKHVQSSDSASAASVSVGDASASASASSSSVLVDNASGNATALPPCGELASAGNATSLDQSATTVTVTSTVTVSSKETGGLAALIAGSVKKIKADAAKHDKAKGDNKGDKKLKAASLAMGSAVEAAGDGSIAAPIPAEATAGGNAVNKVAAAPSQEVA